ncbi:MAG: divergent PAP2 family protein [Candidatus Pacebacteria bacterium]|nr:divergent PAP2 family protein [Candidatus Paceibacterota bacterium]
MSNEIFINILENEAIIATLTAWFIAQTMKVIFVSIKKKKFSPLSYFIPGGFPSSHSASVSALSTVIGFEAGFNSPIFAVSIAFTVFVLYDASVLRRAAQKQAQSLNDLIEFINLKGMEPLREVLGHSWVEISAGCILGILVGLIVLL